MVAYYYMNTNIRIIQLIHLILQSGVEVFIAEATQATLFAGHSACMTSKWKFDKWLFAAVNAANRESWN